MVMVKVRVRRRVRVRVRVTNTSLVAPIQPTKPRKSHKDLTYCNIESAYRVKRGCRVLRVRVRLRDIKK